MARNSPAVAEPVRRPRGRPPKAPEALDEGNRRQELLRGAARLFRDKGFAATTTRDIAAAAGMQSGSPFYHFESKAALLFAVMEQGMRAALRSQAQALQAALAQPQRQPPEAVLRTLVRAHFDLRPKGIIQALDLLRPIYSKTAAFGHFGRDEPEFTWENLDKAEALRADAGIKLETATA